MYYSIKLVNVSFTRGVVIGHKASGEVCRPTVAQNSGVTIGSMGKSSHTRVGSFGCDKPGG